MGDLQRAVRLGADEQHRRRQIESVLAWDWVRLEHLREQPGESLALSTILEFITLLWKTEGRWNVRRLWRFIRNRQLDGQNDQDQVINQRRMFYGGRDVNLDCQVRLGFIPQQIARSGRADVHESVQEDEYGRLQSQDKGEVHILFIPDLKC